MPLTARADLDPDRVTPATCPESDRAALIASKTLIAKYAAKFDAAFPHDMIGNIDKAYDVIEHK